MKLIGAQKWLCGWIVVILLVPIFGCISTPNTDIQESIHLPEPTPVVPEDWPSKLVLYGKSGESTEHDAKTLYETCYFRGWNEYIYMYANDFPDCLDIGFRCQSGYEQIADWDGNEACKVELQKLEQEHGRKRLVEFLRKNAEPFQNNQ